MSKTAFLPQGFANLGMFGRTALEPVDQQLPPGVGLDNAVNKIKGKNNDDSVDNWPPGWAIAGGERPKYKTTANDFGGPILEFDGTNHRMLRDNFTLSKTTNGGATVVARVNSTDVALSNNRHVLDTRSDASGAGLVIWCTADDLKIWSGGTNTTLTAKLTNDTEITIGVRWNNGTTDVDVFLDGASDTTGIAWGANDINGSDDWHLAENYLGDGHWKGQIFSLYVWDRNLSDQEMYDAHQATLKREGKASVTVTAIAHDFTAEIPVSTSTGDYTVLAPWMIAHDFTAEIPVTTSTDDYTVLTPWMIAHDFTAEIPVTTSTDDYTVLTPWMIAHDFTAEIPVSTTTDTY